MPIDILFKDRFLPGVLLSMLESETAIDLNDVEGSDSSKMLPSSKVGSIFDVDGLFGENFFFGSWPAESLFFLLGGILRSNLEEKILKIQPLYIHFKIF